MEFFCSSYEQRTFHMEPIRNSEKNLTFPVVVLILDNKKWFPWANDAGGNDKYMIQLVVRTIGLSKIFEYFT